MTLNAGGKKTVITEPLSADQSPNAHDAAGDPVIDGITAALADSCNAPVSVLTVLSNGEEVVRSTYGLNGLHWPIDQGFFPLAQTAGADQLQINDAMVDARTADHPWVKGEPAVRFIAGHRLVGKSGTVLGMLSVIDVFARQLNQAEQETLRRLGRLIVMLLEADRKPTVVDWYRKLENVDHSAFFITDPNFEERPLIYCNDAFCRLIGYPRDVLLGRNTQIFGGPATDQIAINALLRDIELGSTRPTVVKVYRRDGAERWFEFTGLLDSDPADGIHRFVWVANDVTKQVSLQIRGRKNGSLSDEILMNMTCQVFVTDPDTRRFVLVNFAACDALGYTEDELLDMGPVDLVPHISDDSYVKMVGPILDGSIDTLIRRTIYRRKDGSVFPVENHLRRATFHNKTMVVKFSEDLSFRREIEQLIRNSHAKPDSGDSAQEQTEFEYQHKMQESLSIAHRANAEKSKFLAAAGHDLRQPLHAIGLGLTALDDVLVTPKSQEVGRLIRHSIDAMGDLLESLLDVSRFDTGSVTVLPTQFAVDTLLVRLVASSTLAAFEKGVKLECEESGVIVFTDAALLERVLSNLVANAIRFTDTGLIQVSTTVRANTLRISVSDSGVGIPTESLDRIFDEYSQLDGGVVSSKEGVGLGLAIVKRISDLLELGLKVHSRPGAGSTFSVDVPLADSADTAALLRAPTPNKAVPELTGQVLLVEDNGLVAAATVASLQTETLQFHHAENRDQAMAAISAGLVPDVLITDYHLPRENGVKVIEDVRAALNSTISAIVITGDTKSVGADFNRLSNCQLLKKPVAIARLKTGLATALEFDSVA